MPQPKANPICRATPVLTFAADNSGSHRVKRPLFLLTTGLLFAAGTFAAKPPNVVPKRGYGSHQSGKWWQGHYSRGGFTHGMTHGDPKRGGRHGDEGLKIGREGLQPIFDLIDDDGDKPFFVWYAPFLPHKPSTNATEPELYNLTKDPHETQNLAKTNPHQAKRLAKQLNELLPES